MNVTSAPRLAQRVSALLRPITAGAATATPEPPEVRIVAAGEVPEPQRTLLVHGDGMTPTLERHWGCRLELRVVADLRSGADLVRHVHLVTADQGRLASFGAIRLDLGRFPEQARLSIVANQLPLGTILREHGVAHRRLVSGFFEITADRLPHARLSCEGSTRLHGRHSVLLSPEAEVMAEVVEILPAPLPGSVSAP